jgi:two-component system sensor histidine kinase YesM
LLLGICLLILALSIAVIFFMNRTISRPVALIRKKIDGIAAGDFSPDPGIESESEIGSVGKGINKLSLDVIALMESRIADEKQKRELEYRMLQSQVNPHFLYNTLGTIKWMATLQKAGGIVEVTTALSRLLRTISKDLRKEVPLRDEVLLLDDYFLILKYRYGGTVEFIKRIENEALLKCMIPRFVLQPLMENAIFHGIEPKGKGRIELRIERAGEAVCVSIWDDGVGIAPDALALLNNYDEKTQAAELAYIGMRSVHQRIQNAYGDAYGLTAQSEQNVYTKMTIRIPFNTPSKKPPVSVKQEEGHV